MRREHLFPNIGAGSPVVIHQTFNSLDSPIQDEPMRDVDPLQVSRIVLWYAEQIQVISLLLITDLEQSDTEGLKKSPNKNMKHLQNVRTRTNPVSNQLFCEIKFSVEGQCCHENTDGITGLMMAEGW